MSFLVFVSGSRDIFATLKNSFPFQGDNQTASLSKLCRNFIRSESMGLERYPVSISPARNTCLAPGSFRSAPLNPPSEYGKMNDKVIVELYSDNIYSDVSLDRIAPGSLDRNAWCYNTIPCGILCVGLSTLYDRKTQNRAQFMVYWILSQEVCVHDYPVPTQRVEEGMTDFIFHFFF